MTKSRALRCLLAPLVLIGCGGGTEPAATPVVATVAVSTSSPSVIVGDTVRLTATVRDQQGATLTGAMVTWSSSDAGRATVSTAGLVSGLAPGGVTISASVGGKSGSALLQVKAAAIAGAGDSPVSSTIQRVPFEARAEDYSTTHPDLPGFPISHNTLMLSFAPGVTTRQANAILDSIGATLVGSLPGAPGQTPGILFLRLTNGSHAAMRQLIDGLRADARIATAVEDALIGTNAITKGNNGTAADWDWEVTPEGHNWGLEVIRAPQMWNFNAAIEKERQRTGQLPPMTGILDTGFEPSHPDLEYEYLSTVNPADHGTQVAGVIGAKFNDGFGMDGVNPFARMKVWAYSSFASGNTALDLKASWGKNFLWGVDSLLRARPGIRTVNMSVGYNWWSIPIDADANPRARSLASTQGLLFVDMLKALAETGASLPVFTVSAGNDSRTGDTREARYNSPMTAAALIHGAAPIIVVESLDRSSGAGGATRLGSSNVNGDVSAPGAQLLGPVGSNGFAAFSGTSAAAPHVTGLVGYLYTLLPSFPAPTLTANKVRDLILANAVAVAGGASPRIDAFATMLDADRVVGGNTVLKKLVDIDDGSSDGNRRDLPSEDIDGDLGVGDGAIDMSDFRRWRDWLLQIEDPAGLSLDGPSNSMKLDINGDGVIGFSQTDSDENVYPRGDFNGDGILSRTATRKVPGVLGGQNVTDLQVLQRLFSDPNYLASELPGLLNSVDIRIQGQGCLALSGVVRVQSAIRATGEDTSAYVRIHDGNPEQIYTAPFRPNGWTASAKAIDITGTVIGESEQAFALPLGSDVSWTPTCPPPPCPVSGSLQNVCPPPPPPPPPPDPSDCPDVRIDTNARLAANLDLVCALNMSIGGFNNSLTDPVVLPSLTRVWESFALRGEAPGGLSLPALESVGSSGGCGLLFELAKVAVLDLPALKNAFVCGLAVGRAPDLTTIKLGALTLVEGELWITDNPKLTDISGIRCGARISGNLTIMGNPLLSTAAAQALAACLTVTGQVTITGNKP